MNINYKLNSYKGELKNNFTEVPNDIYGITDGASFKIYCYLCKIYNKEEQHSAPTVKQISNDCNIGTSTVKRALKKLEEAGLIKILKSKNNTYDIYFPIIIKDEEENKVVFIDDNEEEKIFVKEIKIKENKYKNRKTNSKYDRWRKDVLERDNYTCQICGNKENLHVHHIKRYADNEELRTDINNGITLCNVCHSNITGKESKYEDMFIKIILEKILKKFGGTHDE